MYVCLCQGITDRDVKRAAERGARSLRELRAELGVGTGCGKCGAFARDLLAEYAVTDRELRLARPAA